MGDILNKLSYKEVEKLENRTPDRADWITDHADATGLATVEVERLWNRFRQIHNSDDETKLYLTDKPLPKELPNDIFIRNLLQHFPRSSSNADAIPFGNFITVLLWLDGADIDNKLAAVFLYLNNGGLITVGMLHVLLRFLYTDFTDEEVQRLAIKSMRQLGSDENGALDQKQFIEAVKRLIPRDELEQILQFSIIPQQLLIDVRRMPSPEVPSTALDSINKFLAFDLISNYELQQLSKQASRKNWPKLAYQLGFLEYDVEAYQLLHNYDTVATIYSLLQTWREQEGESATKTRLKQVLRESDLEELVFILK